MHPVVTLRGMMISMRIERLLQLPRKSIVILKEAYRSPMLPYFIVGLGVLIRLRQYTVNRSLWLDEAMLSLNIINRSFLELLQPLDYVQAAPVAFLLGSKYLGMLWGYGEIVLRLLPFIFGLLALIIYFPLAGNLARPQAFPLALSLLALSRYAIYYSAEVKQYSVDLALTVLILLVTWTVFKGGYNGRGCLLLGLIGIAAVWCSQAVIFTLAGAGSALFVEAWLSRKKMGNRPLKRTAMIGLLWISSFLINYCIFVRPTIHQNFYAFWQSSFFPFPPRSYVDLLWLPNVALSLINNPIGMVTPGLAIAAMVAGTIYLWRSGKRFILLISYLPFVALITATLLRFYPLSDRLVLFLAPVFFLIIAEGGYQIFTYFRDNRILGFVFLFVLLLYPLGSGFTRLIRPELVQESRPVINYYLENRHEDESIYMNFSAQYAFKYYTREQPIDYQIWEEPVGKTIYIEERFFALEDEFKKKGRAWFLFSFLPTSAAREPVLLSFLDTKGARIGEYQAVGASIYLYDFNTDITVQGSTESK